MSDEQDETRPGYGCDGSVTRAMNKGSPVAVSVTTIR